MAVKKSSKGSKGAKKAAKKNRASSKKSKSVARKAPMKGARKIVGGVSQKGREVAPRRKSLPEGGTTESEASALESSNSTGDV